MPKTQAAKQGVGEVALELNFVEKIITFDWLYIK